MVLGSDLRRGNGRRTRGSRGTALAATLVLLLAPALAACSDDSGGGSDSTPPTPSVEQTEQTTSAPAATAPADPVAAEKEIKENWQKFFDPKTALKDKQAVLENGDKMSAVLAGFSGDARGGQVEAEVTKVAFTSPTAADVTYTLTLKGATALPDASGTAVEEDGTWKVSVNTLCALVQLSGNASQSPAAGC
ncbi:membrane protein [Streptomyces sp. MMG1533]|uniref:hypothetical protein n=1 Tax=Streptomyces sp. MMG1533 TaxID=1415546 RepID=UPI0006AE40B8|nr:hypothetical protein [Streptomyces sp. MMG1533]KOU65636.1 membrane protein [Streptomyces sp. MMG1533]